MFIDFLERKGERETLIWDVRTLPTRGLNLQPFGVQDDIQSTEPLGQDPNFLYIWTLLLPLQSPLLPITSHFRALLELVISR